MEPADVPGPCPAQLYFMDDYERHQLTLRCSRSAGHAGEHQTSFQRAPAHRVTVTWDVDEQPARARADAVLRGWHDADFARIPEEEGEDYLAGFVDELIAQTQRGGCRGVCKDLGCCRCDSRS